MLDLSFDHAGLLLCLKLYFNLIIGFGLNFILQINLHFTLYVKLNTLQKCNSHWAESTIRASYTIGGAWCESPILLRETTGQRGMSEHSRHVLALVTWMMPTCS